MSEVKQLNIQGTDFYQRIANLSEAKRTALARRLHQLLSGDAGRQSSPDSGQLVAYLTHDPQHAPTAEELQQYLRTLLPDYMVPRRVVLLEALPLTPSGKVDVRALPELGRGVAGEVAESFIAPRGAAEEEIAAVWAEVLGVERVGLWDNFFDLGGHSLLLVAAHARLRERYGARLTMMDMFRYPSVGALAQFLTEGEAEQDSFQESGEHADTRRKFIEQRRRSRQSSAAEGDAELLPHDPEASVDSNAVAIIGMAGRFPKASNLDEFWQHLRDGVESLSSFSDEELESSGVAPAVFTNPKYVRVRGVIEGNDLFDAAFFGITPREAEVMEPQHRLLLEAAWEAMEEAGYDTARYTGRIGLFAGESTNSYLLSNLYSNPDIIKAIGLYQTLISNDRDHLATQISYKLNLRGPSVVVQTACSTSLVAVHLACQSLLSGESDIALAGGVSIGTPQKVGYLYQEGGIASPDGHCRAFDASARGTVGGSGLGLVVLKRLPEAVRDGDHLHAVIRGSAINNDGSGKVGYTAPSIQGQAAVISEALRAAGLSPRDISYVEAHGTATPLGDPVEVAALRQAFAAADSTTAADATAADTSEHGVAAAGSAAVGSAVADDTAQADGAAWCGLGSVKSNVGHLDAAAGVTGLIKTVLSLRHRQLPPTLHFERANPALGLDGSPFYVNDRLRPWDVGGKGGDGAGSVGGEGAGGNRVRRAGVSSFGIGGTNAHVVVEEAARSEGGGAATRGWQLLLVSGRSEWAAREAERRLGAHLAGMAAEAGAGGEASGEAEEVVTGVAADASAASARLADVAYTLATGRRQFTHRRVVACRSAHQAGAALLAPHSPLRAAGRAGARPRAVLFLFPGQGSQYHRMGAELYDAEPTFRRTIDECAGHLRHPLGGDLREALGYGAHTGPLSERLGETWLTQPALFAVEYALALLFEGYGVVAAAMLGHSVGEYVAACLAGVMEPEDALRLVAERGRLMAASGAGAMLGVGLSAAEVEALGLIGVEVAASNGRRRSVLSGGVGAVEEAGRRLTAEGASWRRLAAGHAFHSEAMGGEVAEGLRAALRGVRLRAPRRAFVSNVTGRWAGAEVAEGEYWVRQMRGRVRFAEGLGEVQRGGGEWAALEVGPGRVLSGLARQEWTAAAAEGEGESRGTARRRDEGDGGAARGHGEGTGGAAVVAVVAVGGMSAEGLGEAGWAVRAAGELWANGAEVELAGMWAGEERLRASLPTYPFERQRFWIEPVRKQQTLTESSAQANANAQGATARREEPMSTATKGMEAHMSESQAHESSASARLEGILSKLKNVATELSGLDESQIDSRVTFFELGFDSLMLMQVSQGVQNKFGVEVSFRQLFEEIPTLDALAVHLSGILPPEEPQAPAPSQVEASAPPRENPEYASLAAALTHGAGAPAAPEEGPDGNGKSGKVVDGLMRLMSRQLDVLQAALSNGGPASSKGVAAITPAAHTAQTGQTERPAPGASQPRQEEAGATLRAAAEGGVTQADGRPELSRATPEPFGPWRPVKSSAGGSLSHTQQGHLDALVERFNRRTRESKRMTQEYRPVLADTRVSAGFRQMWKELVYPVVASRAAGSKVWDVDGNEYVDVIMGFGVNLLGHTPPFVREALEEQLAKGIHIGPQSNLAGQVAELISELTGVERVTFCNTGSEAVMAALRLARTVTGRQKIALFSGSYHGITDEVLVRRTFRDGTQHPLPAAPGIPPEMVANVMVLDYDRPESLDILRAHAHELAAVLVEPVQSSRPELQPREFLHELRRLTEASGTALIFDEMITGFRIHPGGAQAWFDVRADIVTYGKIVGGGMPIGVIAGKAAFMDAVDGGMWNFGDESYPKANQTFFAGTFSKHPLAMAAARSVLGHLKQSGPQLQQRLNERTTRFAETLNGYFEQDQVPMRVRHWGSLFRLAVVREVTHAHLLIYHLLEKGVFMADRSGFLSTAHTDEDVDFIVGAIKEGVAEMRAGGFLPDAPTHSPARDKSVSRAASHAHPAASSPAASGNGSAQATSQAATEEQLPPATRSVPLTAAQKGLLTVAQMGDEASSAYNETMSLRLRGRFNVEAMREALRKVVGRHESLRATFDLLNECQYVAPPADIAAPLVDFSRQPEGERAAQVERWLERECAQPFDLSRGPVLRVSILKLGEEEHLLVLTTHHVLTDGWSFDILLGEVGAFYSAACEGKDCVLPPPTQFSEYALWQTRQQAGARISASEAYWTERFSGAAPVLALPVDRPRPPVQTYAGVRERVKFDAALTRDLRTLSARHGCTLFMTLLAEFQLLLHHLTGQDDIVVGTHSAGQASINSQSLIGFCINMLPLRSRIGGDDPTLAQYLAATKKHVLDGSKHQDYPVSHLIKKLKLVRDPSRPPLVSVVFNMDRSASPAPSSAGTGFAGLRVESVENPVVFARFDLLWNVVDTGGGLVLEFTYNTDLFEKDSVRRWVEKYETLLRGAVARPDARLSELASVLKELDERGEDAKAEALASARREKFKGVKRRSAGSA